MCTLCHQLRSSSYYQFAIIVNYGAVLLLGVVALMAGSPTGVPMSPGYGRYQTATHPPYFTTLTYATTGYYTPKAPEYYITTYDTQSYYTEAPKYNCPVLHHQRAGVLHRGFQVLHQVGTGVLHDYMYAVPAYYPTRKQLQYPIFHQLHSSSCNKFAVMGTMAARLELNGE